LDPFNNNGTIEESTARAGERKGTGTIGRDGTSRKIREFAHVGKRESIRHASHRTNSYCIAADEFEHEFFEAQYEYFSAGKAHVSWEFEQAVILRPRRSFAIESFYFFGERY
jgi:hypothetical protein